MTDTTTIGHITNALTSNSATALITAEKFVSNCKDWFNAQPWFIQCGLIIGGCCLTIYCNHNVCAVVYRRYYGYPAGPIGIPYFGSLFTVLYYKQQTFNLKLLPSYGPITMHAIGSTNVLTINDVNLVKAVLHNRACVERPSAFCNLFPKHSAISSPFVFNNEKWYLRRLLLLNGMNKIANNKYIEKNLNNNILNKILYVRIEEHLHEAWMLSSDIKNISFNIMFSAIFGFYKNTGIDSVGDGTGTEINYLNSENEDYIEIHECIDDITYSNTIDNALLWNEISKYSGISIYFLQKLFKIDHVNLEKLKSKKLQVENSFTQLVNLLNDKYFDKAISNYHKKLAYLEEEAMENVDYQLPNLDNPVLDNFYNNTNNSNDDNNNNEELKTNSNTNTNTNTTSGSGSGSASDTNSNRGSRPTTPRKARMSVHLTHQVSSRSYMNEISLFDELYKKITDNGEDVNNPENMTTDADTTDYDGATSDDNNSIAGEYKQNVQTPGQGKGKTKEKADFSDITKEELTSDLLGLLMLATNSFSTIFEACILYIAKYPDLQDAIFEEVRKKSLKNRKYNKLEFICSELNDCGKLRAFINEVLRILAIEPKGMPHSIEKNKKFLLKFNINNSTGLCDNIIFDDINNIDVKKAKREFSYIIDSSLFIEANLGYILTKDSKIWGNSGLKLDISRWIKLDSITKKAKYIHNEKSIPFGYGKRHCIGKNFALKSLSIILANVLLNYKFKPNNINNDKFDGKFKIGRNLKHGFTKKIDAANKRSVPLAVTVTKRHIKPFSASREAKVRVKLPVLKPIH